MLLIAMKYGCLKIRFPALWRLNGNEKIIDEYLKFGNNFFKLNFILYCFLTHSIHFSGDKLSQA
jgi:hypothetical protein